MVIALPAKMMLGACSSTTSSWVSGAVEAFAFGIRSAKNPPRRNITAPKRSDQGAPNTAMTPAPRTPPTVLATTPINARREFASTNASSDLTTAGTSEAFATVWPFASTNAKNANGYR
ncbi:unannotated protein [freshwater metagenome]|uniref:Unannotated protein n=1 Tax=freshwater metagenome TaxID=449393 RepID=A0A6J7NK72_9ZZZZ